MSVASTSVKLAGLVFAMGLFGMGPGTILLDEIKARWEKKRTDDEEETAALVAPPGETHLTKQTTQHRAPHMLEGTPSIPPQVQKRLSEDLAHEAAHDFVKHPFLPVNIPAKATGKISSETNKSEKAPYETLSWLSFMIGTSSKLSDETTDEKRK